MHFVPRNQAGTARQMSHDLTYMWNLKKKKKNWTGGNPEK